MHASGNDYCFIDERENYYNDYPALAKKISDRHFGAGSDGLIVLSETSSADIRMTMFNSDGTHGEICGNALRCIGKHLYDKSIRASDNLNKSSKEKCNKKTINHVFRVLTDAGVKKIESNEDGKSFTVNMGNVVFRGENLPSVSTFLFPFGKKEYLFSGASVGNPHAVCVVDNFDFDYLNLARELNGTDFFPFGANVEFVKPDDEGVQMRVIERGSGETLSCGSGSCAAAAVLCRLGLKNFGKIKINSPGGLVFVEIREDFSAKLSGEAHYVFEGRFFF